MIEILLIVPWGEAPTMLFKNNPAISREHFFHPIGKLAAGCCRNGYQWSGIDEGKAIDER